MMKKVPWIELKDVSKSFRLDSGNEIRVLKGVNLKVEDDEVVALLGPSGSGKSTCLRIMSGLIQPSTGEVLCQGVPLKAANLHVSFVFQSFALFPWETVETNISLALEPLKLEAKERNQRIKRAIDLVGLEGFEEAYPRELSGGMKQRVGIARALVMERPILFLDEPFSALDVLTADTLRTEMTKIFLEKKTATRSMAIVTHNIQEAVFMAKRILIMGTHPGVIRREIINDLPYPRVEDSLAFKRQVAQIHSFITETLMPDHPTTPEAILSGKLHKEPPVETLPPVQVVEIIGLLEAIELDGEADIFELAHETGHDFGRTLYIVKAAEILRLADTPQQLVVLTPLGKKFLSGDMNARKKMLHELFGSLKIVQMTTNLLKRESSLRIDRAQLRERVAEWLPNENPDVVIETLVSWGRFSEYFGYNDDQKEVYLDVHDSTHV